MNRSLLVRAATAETLTDGPASLITLLADSGTTGGALTANRATLRADSPGAPPHYHSGATEMFFVLDGQLQALDGDSVVTLDTGDLLVVPPGRPHAFAPAPGAAADVLIAFSPGMNRFDYYRLLERVHLGTADIAEVRASSERFDNHYVDSPAWRAARAAATAPKDPTR
ncbi:cupin domain-containing protein [Streptomyces litchfieldiae]|uniref:Cupin domain-containing protein n=1 Tax=Streptomyces litchfieldiae TaxID=3075543 RepID=A0ABU2MJQ5_9ACTN|nr:cupin domain-containing protein [Streptomyces sp. DSM 44938]MDT0341824.1 cupin domain-containing protein [Streptomyces sp. DSM 44938]